MRPYFCALALLVTALSAAGGADASAQGVVRVTPALVHVEIPVGRGTRESWRWYGSATPDGRAEYVWSIQLDGDSTHAFGFKLFKFPGSTERAGTFAELLRAGQADVATVTGHVERVLRGVRPMVRGEDSVLVVELRDATLIARMFARKPATVTMITLSPYAETSSRRVPVTYEGF